MEMVNEVPVNDSVVVTRFNDLARAINLLHYHDPEHSNGAIIVLLHYMKGRFKDLIILTTFLSTIKSFSLGFRQGFQVTGSTKTSPLC